MIHKELLELTSNAFNATMFGGTLGKVFNIIIMINGSRTRTGMKKKLEDAIAKYAREAFTKEMSQMPPELLREIETEAKKTLPELLQEIETEAKKTLPKLLQEIETKAKETAKNKVDEYVLQMFKTADENMKNQAKVSYPESVLETLAKITADCLSLQPELRPTAEGIFGQFQDLAFSDWGKGYYRIQTSDKSIRSSDNILEVIWPKDEN
jgi:vacuolar-type H+-ATPase subunit H